MPPLNALIATPLPLGFFLLTAFLHVAEAMFDRDDWSVARAGFVAGLGSSTTTSWKFLLPALMTEGEVD
jgi:hypothetical protein